MSAQVLFSPIQVGALKLPHRIVMAPLTRCRAEAGGVPHALNAKYYSQRAGAALIVSEATQVSPTGVGYMGTPGIHSDAQVSGWKLVTKAVHDRGGKIFLQLWHVGRISHPDLQPNGQLPISASAIAPNGKAMTPTGPKPFVTPRELESDEIPGVINEYRIGAQNAKQAGFDGVEIHGANGYLLDQFLRDGSNKRTDNWGGSVENRARLQLEVTRAAIEVWGSNRVGIRLSPNGTFNDMSDSNPEVTFGYLVKKLSELNLAYLHLVGQLEGDAKRSKHEVPLEFFRSIYPGIIMANGGYSLETSSQLVKDRTADLVSFGKLFIANPDLPERFQKKAALNSPDTSTFYSGGEKGYTDYPTL